MSKRKILILSIVVSLSLIGIGITSFTVFGQEYQVSITDVIDGDTMNIQFQNGSTDTIRLIGVDTPEVHTSTNPQEFEGIPDNSDGKSWLSLWGDKATTYAKKPTNKQTSNNRI